MARLSAELEGWCAQPLRLLVSGFPRFVTAILGSVERKSIPLLAFKRAHENGKPYPFGITN